MLCSGTANDWSEYLLFVTVRTLLNYALVTSAFFLYWRGFICPKLCSVQPVRRTKTFDNMFIHTDCLQCNTATAGR